VRYHIQHFSCAANSVPLGEILTVKLPSQISVVFFRQRVMITNIFRVVLIQSHLVRFNVTHWFQKQALGGLYINQFKLIGICLITNLSNLLTIGLCAIGK